MSNVRPYEVTVQYFYERVMRITARDAEAAEERAVEIVEGWSGVKHVEAISVEEE